MTMATRTYGRNRVRLEMKGETKFFSADSDPSYAGRCHYCDRRCFRRGSAEVLSNPYCAATTDHVVPRMMITEATAHEVNSGGNTVLSCSFCNRVKAWHPSGAFKSWRMANLDITDIALAQKQFSIFVFALAEAGWRRVRDDAAWGAPASSIAGIVRKVAS